METHDRCGADDTNFGVLVFQRQELRFSVGGVGDKGRLVLDPAIAVAIAEFRCAERGECLGVGGELRRAECLDILRDQGRKCAGDWLAKNFAKLGVESSVDIEKVYL